MLSGSGGCILVVDVRKWEAAMWGIGKTFGWGIEFHRWRGWDLSRRYHFVEFGFITILWPLNLE